jgi:hypothetical protein
MNPGDWLLAILPLLLAAMALLLHGWTLSGIGPATLLTAGVVWYVTFQRLRHRSWLKHRNEEFVPGAQGLVMTAIAGWALAGIAAMAWLWTTLPRR